MKLFEVNMNGKGVVFAYARMNPPHHGHGALIKTLQKVAKDTGADWFLFLSKKNDSKDNPLPYDQKIAWVKALFPEINGHIIEDKAINTPLMAATYLYKQGYRRCAFVAGQDDIESYSKMIKSGNEHGRTNPLLVKQGKGFFFSPLEFAASPRLTSATDARESVRRNDPETFTNVILGPSAVNAQLRDAVQNKLFPLVKKSMGLVTEGKLSHKDPVEKWITTFKKSTHPKFKGKSLSDREKMARMAQYRAVQNKKEFSEGTLTELANNPYHYMMSKRTPVNSSYIFQTDAGTKYIVNIEYSDVSQMIEIGFADQTDRVNPTIDVTGKGDAFRVFSTVGAIVKDYVQNSKRPISRMTFKGKTRDQSRIKLYDMIAKSLPRFVPGFTLYDSGADSEEKQYVFDRVKNESSLPNSNVLESSMIKPKVYLDLDGVLADFFGEWARLSGVDHYKDIDNREAKLQMVREHPTFWEDLPLLPNAKELISTVLREFGEYSICTKPLEGDERCKQGKLNWVKNNLMDCLPVEVIFAEDKSVHAKQNDKACVLVDDYGKNIVGWNMAGGIGIKYEPEAFDEIAQMLKSIAERGIE